MSGIRNGLALHTRLWCGGDFSQRLVPRNPACQASGGRDQRAGYARRSCLSLIRGPGFDSRRLHWPRKAAQPSGFPRSWRRKEQRPLELQHATTLGSHDIGGQTYERGSAAMADLLEAGTEVVPLAVELGGGGSVVNCLRRGKRRPRVWRSWWVCEGLRRGGWRGRSRRPGRGRRGACSR